MDEYGSELVSIGEGICRLNFPVEAALPFQWRVSFC
jgi:hypothetical protein